MLQLLKKTWSRLTVLGKLVIILVSLLLITSLSLLAFPPSDDILVEAVQDEINFSADRESEVNESEVNYTSAEYIPIKLEPRDLSHLHESFSNGVALTVTGAPVSIKNTTNDAYGTARAFIMEDTGKSFFVETEDSFERGDRVLVAGVIDEELGFLRVKPSSLELLSANYTLTSPIELELGEISNSHSDFIVTLKDRVVLEEGNATYGRVFFVGDIHALVKDNVTQVKFVMNESYDFTGVIFRILTPLTESYWPFLFVTDVTKK